MTSTCCTCIIIFVCCPAVPLCLRLRYVQQTQFLDDKIVLIQLLLAVGAESQTDSSSEEEDAEFEPRSLQGQSMGISFQSKPLGMSITALHQRCQTFQGVCMRLWEY